jgi:hypothetical protein
MKNQIIRKPAVAQANQEKAEENIARKLNILEAWSRNGIPLQDREEKNGTSLEYFPTSVRQFNAWDGRKNGNGVTSLLPKISRNANDTLRKKEALYRRVEDVLVALALRRDAQIKLSRPAKLVKLKMNLALEEQLRKILESELIALRVELKMVQKENRVLAERSGSLIEEFRSELAELRMQNERLNAECSDLKRKLSKVAPIKRV